jgi:hypothetical protein
MVNPATPPQPDPDEKLVKVFDSEQESETMVVKGLLESAGIDADVTAVDTARDTFPGVGGSIILVREEDAARARQVIAESRQAPTSTEYEDPEETAEIDITEEPPAKP